MTVLLRNVRTGLFVVDGNEWTRERRLAKDFGKSLAALDYTKEKKLEHMEVVLAFDDPALDLTLPADIPRK